MPGSSINSGPNCTRPPCFLREGLETSCKERVILTAVVHHLLPLLMMTHPLLMMTHPLLMMTLLIMANMVRCQSILHLHPMLIGHLL